MWSIAADPCLCVRGIACSPIHSFMTFRKPSSSNLLFVFSTPFTDSFRSAKIIIEILSSMSFTNSFIISSITALRGLRSSLFCVRRFSCWVHAVVSPSLSLVPGFTRYKLYIFKQRCLP